MNNYRIYTDGSYRSSTDSMGIGVVWTNEDKLVDQYSRRILGGTNNQAELFAILLALKSIKAPLDSLEIYTDSQYCIGCITNESWKPKLNLELISTIKEQLKQTQSLIGNPIKFIHIKGHNGDKFNELADKLATTASL